MIAVGSGELLEVILSVQDMNLQVAFYRDILGLRVKDPEAAIDFRDFYRVEMNTGSCSLVLHIGDKPVSSGDVPQFALRVMDIKASRASLLAKGVPLSEIRSPAPDVFVCDGTDPEGNVFSLESRLDTPFTKPGMTPTPSMAPVYVFAHSRRGRSITLMRDNQLIVIAEVVIMLAVLIALPFFSIVPLLSAFLLVMALLWLAGNNWTKLGMRRPEKWRNTVFISFGFGLFFIILMNFAIAPLVTFFVQSPPNLTAYSIVHENPLLLLASLFTSWTSLAFAEEMIFRGYLMNRLADLFGRSSYGWTLALVIQAAVFGIEHLSQGLAGILITAIYGALLGLLYLGTKRNLWTCIIAHGMYSSIFFLTRFL